MIARILPIDRMKKGENEQCFDHISFNGGQVLCFILITFSITPGFDLHALQIIRHRICLILIRNAGKPRVTLGSGKYCVTERFLIPYCKKSVVIFSATEAGNTDIKSAHNDRIQWDGTPTSHSQSTLSKEITYIWCNVICSPSPFKHVKGGITH
jgi:hypothetical protein